MKIKCDLLRQYNKRDLLRRKTQVVTHHSTLVIVVLYADMMVMLNLLRHINERHLVCRKFFLPCKKSRFIFFDKTGYIS